MIHLWRIRFRYRKMTRIVARRVRGLGHEVRPREKALRVLPAAKSRDAMVAASGKVTKAKDRVSIVIRQGMARLRQALRQARNGLATLTRNIAENVQKLAERSRAREDELRGLVGAKSREAIVAAKGKIAKNKARVSIAFEQGTARLRQVRNGLGQVRNRLGQAQNKLKGLTRSIAEKRQKRAEERRARRNELRVQAASYPKAVVEANHKITKTKAQLSIVPGQWTAHLLQAQNPLAGLARSIAEKPQKPAEELHAREDELRVQVARSQETTVEADNKVTTVEGQAPGAPATLEQWAAHFQQAQSALAGLTKSIPEKPQRMAKERRTQELQKPPEEPRAREDELRVQAARPRETVVEADSKITKVKAQLSAGFEQGTSRLRRARKTLAGLGRNITDKRQRGRQELGARESQMRELLENSPDAIAVINGDHCFVTANRKALDLFGVSERNLGKFSIDVFLFRGQIADLQRNGSSFMGRQEKHGKCTIRRLDGSLRAAEFAFVTDFLPLQHLCRFYDLHMPRPTPIQHRIGPGTQDASHAGQAH